MGICDCDSKAGNNIVKKEINKNIIDNNSKYLENINKKNDDKICNNNNVMENPNKEQIIISTKQSQKISREAKIYICKVIRGRKCGTGFLCKIPFPDEFNYLPVLMTNYHVITKDELLNDKELMITFKNDSIKTKINITPERKIYSLSEKNYDLTIIEIFPEEDKIFHFLELDFKYVGNEKNKDVIYILQYPGGVECSFSYGKIQDIQDNEIYYDCSTLEGSSGGPIILLRNHKIIGIHRAFDSVAKYNFGTFLLEPINKFIEIFYKNGLRAKNNYVNCIICEYEIKNEEEIALVHDYNEQIRDINDESRELYIESKKKKKELEKNINIYIDDELINFNFKYKPNKNTIKARFIFKENFKDLSFLFYKCKNLISVDLSPYNAISNVNNMSYMFGGCRSLKSIDFFSFNTDNVKNLSNIFSECESLETIDLSSFNTSRVLTMEKMFYECSSIKRLDLTSFNTINVTNMSKMFFNCHSIKFLYLSSFKTDNVKTMERMFSRCSSIKTLNLSSFNTSEVENMEGMFEYCSNLEALNVTSFNTIKVTNMNMMFRCCFRAKSLDLSSFNTINVEYMFAMFFGDKFLESLDLSLFNTNKVIVIEGIFDGCTKLKTIKCNDEKILKQKKFTDNKLNEIYSNLSKYYNLNFN